ncbi:MAG: lipid-A-disaccharide synthase [Melioribacteraceae bacterium]|nr:lipid-A-disaccharide synthase [Melioribacteraceae bacterium]
MNNKLLIIAGEASGDLHGASLINELKKRKSDLIISGVGGDKMIAGGMDALFHIKDMAFLGFVEVIKHIPFIKKVQNELIEHVKKENIKTVVLIDYPGFNLSIAKKFKALGIEIVYYISPQIWAWGQHRVKKIKKLVSKMLVLFPFEKKFYEKHGIEVEYVGHPLIEQIEKADLLSRKDFFEKFNLDEGKKILLILPGSRIHEIEKIFPKCLDAAENLCGSFNMQTVVACSENIDANIFNPYLNNKFKIIKGFTYELFKYSEFGIIKSGTSTLEAGLFELPFIVVYYTSRLTYLIGRTLVKIKNIALVNIVAEKNIVHELIQDDVNTDNIVQKSSDIMSSSKKCKEIKSSLSELRSKLGSVGASSKAAEIILAELDAVKRN